MFSDGFCCIILIFRDRNKIDISVILLIVLLISQLNYMFRAFSCFEKCRLVQNEKLLWWCSFDEFCFIFLVFLECIFAKFSLSVSLARKIRCTTTTSLRWTWKKTTLVLLSYYQIFYQFCCKNEMNFDLFIVYLVTPLSRQQSKKASHDLLVT